MLSDKEFSFRGDSAPPEDEEIPDKVIPVVPTQKMEVKPPEQLKKEEVKVPSVSLMNQKSYEEPIHKLDSSEDIEIPEFGFEEKEEIIRKHNISEEALNRERSFSEDIVESLDGLTQSFIEERNSVAAIFDENDSEENAGMTAADFSDIVTAKGSSVDPFKEPDIAAAEEPVSEPVAVVKPVAEPVAVFNPVVEPVTEPVAKPAVEPAPHVRKAAETREFDTEYKDSDPKIESLLIELVLSPEMYKVKMESLSKVISEDPRNYENLVEFAIARYKFAAATVKREIQYYSKKVQEEPKNAKYSQNLKSYREEILKLNSDLKEEMNVLKNEYY
jgi:hypothetical protein